MKLFEHPDFEQAMLRAAEHFRQQGLRPAVIEKDYYVTEALRIIAVNGELSVGLRRSVGLGGESEAVALGHPIMPVGDGLGS
jgi:hypothetical protein